MSDNKYQVTFTFPTEDMMEDFVAYMSDGGGEQGAFYIEDDDNMWSKASFDYSRCFPAWGWKKGEPKYIDIKINENEK